MLKSVFYIELSAGAGVNGNVADLVHACINIVKQIERLSLARSLRSLEPAENAEKSFLFLFFSANSATHRETCFLFVFN